MAFNRIIKVTAGKPGELGTKIENLRMSFEVNKTDTKSQNQADIKIYNLSNETANTIGQAKNKIILEAGYDDEGANNLFFGDITSAIQKVNGPDKILEITAFDGNSNYQSRDISVGYSAGTTAQQIFNDLVSAFGLPLVDPSITITGSYANGWSFIGYVKDALTEVLAKAGYFWSIQNEQLVILRPGFVVQRTGLLITPNTGLIRSPEPLSDQDIKQVDGETVPKRYKIKSLLYAQILPGASIKIESNVVNGTFIVETAKYVGDNWEGEFTVEAEVRQV